jgi:hypothetical protein
MDPIVIASARSPAAYWRHLGMANCADQVEAHLESEFPDLSQLDLIGAVDAAMDEEFPLFA